MHRAVLEVTLRNGTEVIGQRQVRFEVVMLDAKGRPLHREHELFLEAARVRSDTRLRPDEERTIELTFRDVSARRLSLHAALSYEYSTETLVTKTGEAGAGQIEPVAMKFLIASLEKTIRSSRR